VRVVATGAAAKSIRSAVLNHFVAYHNTDKWGRWKVAMKGRLDSFFTAKKYHPQTLVGHCLWAIEGVGSPKRYRLVSFGVVSQ
jgi:hypothetical protein